MKRGKKYIEAAKLVDRTQDYPIEEAVALVRKTNTVKFDASVEAAFRLNVDPRHADQQIRGAMVLPNGTGRSQKVLVIAEGPKAEEAKQAGADYVGSQDMLDEIAKGWLDFDVIIATPNMMGKLGRFGKILGPKGLMPNPKTGTVTMDVTHAVNEVKKGKITYRVDKQGNISCLIGKLSFTDDQLVQNFKALYEQIQKVRPAAVKGAYMKNVTIASTMGPGVKVAHD